MKFGENLQYYATAEWRDKYIDYEKLKTLLEEAQTGHTDTYLGDDEKERPKHKTLQTPGDEVFFREIAEQLEKVNHFYNERYSKVVQTFNGLKKDVEFYKNPKEETESSGGVIRRRKFLRAEPEKNAIKPKSLKELKANFSDFYLSLVLLDRYQKINFDGFRKILKKFDKNMYSTYGDSWRKKHIEKERSFYTNKHISNLLLQTETIVAEELEDGDRKKARKKLGVPSLESKELSQDKNDFTLFRVGIFLGMGLVVLSAIVLSIYPARSCIFADSISSQDDRTLSLERTSSSNTSSFTDIFCEQKDTIIRLYRPGILLAFFIFLLGFNVYGWRKAGVNHVLIFEIDYREHLAPTHLWEVSFVIALTWALSLLAFIHNPLADYLPRYAHPAILYSFLTILIIFPLPIPGLSCYRKARSWLVGRFWRLLFPGYWSVTFADFWLADQLTSMAGFLVDMEYVTCFYAVDGNISNGLSCSSTNINASSTDQSVITYRMNGTSLKTANESLTDEKCLCGELVGGSALAGGIQVFLMMWPAIIRFLQCIRRYVDSGKLHPHITNAGKYSTTLIKVFISYLMAYSLRNVPKDDSSKFVWVVVLFVAHAISSFYSLVWDIKMDWGFLDQSDDSTCVGGLLRDHLVYASPWNWKYYAAFLEDIVFRFLWTLQAFHVPYVSPTLLMFAEVFRRFVWNYFRLENEHLNNCGEFRAVRDITVTQHRKEDLERIEDIMDNRMGPKHRRLMSDPNDNPVPERADYERDSQPRKRVTMMPEMISSSDESSYETAMNLLQDDEDAKGTDELPEFLMVTSGARMNSSLIFWMRIGINPYEYNVLGPNTTRERLTLICKHGQCSTPASRRCPARCYLRVKNPDIIESKLGKKRRRDGSFYDCFRHSLKKDMEESRDKSNYEVEIFESPAVHNHPPPADLSPLQKIFKENSVKRSLEKKRVEYDREFEALPDSFNADIKKNIAGEETYQKKLISARLARRWTSPQDQVALGSTTMLLHDPSATKLYAKNSIIEQFLLSEINTHDGLPIKIWGLASELHLLHDKDDPCFIDGTFNFCSKLPSEGYEHYGHELHIDNWRVDYEGNPAKIIREFWPYALVYGCQFHYAKAILHNWALKLGSKKLVYDKELRAQILNIYLGMPFVDPTIVAEAIRKLETELIPSLCPTKRSKVVALHNYFIKTWVNKRHVNADWNLHALLKRNDTFWTTNQSEALHLSLKKSYKTPPPTIRVASEVLHDYKSFFRGKYANRQLVPRKLDSLERARNIMFHHSEVERQSSAWKFENAVSICRQFSSNENLATNILHYPSAFVTDELVYTVL
ncbi:Oidioi.mRNA.OKI2018_I69.chr2.g8134.t1.cds [Oikopleura dioica]|uniref:Oidioi.mRNA.OKI2018_I69.chr2.g8134.t1.cds n=1 Tax=Oikopleura dioica TaxID=34765 RepID=A0ABN7TEU2_OIKDI|nr:Oidioi.mRNA.OKI2018_I69.chr2.g8134.t1.cds [Oikopleura dioica]